MTKKNDKKNTVVKWFTIILIVIFMIVTFWSFITLLWWNSSKNDWSNLNGMKTISTDGIGN